MRGGTYRAGAGACRGGRRGGAGGRGRSARRAEALRRGRRGRAGRRPGPRGSCHGLLDRNRLCSTINFYQLYSVMCLRNNLFLIFFY